jgi:hypothetical protein
MVKYKQPVKLCILLTVCDLKKTNEKDIVRTNLCPFFQRIREFLFSKLVQEFTLYLKIQITKYYDKLFPFRTGLLADSSNLTRITTEDKPTGTYR